jgi:hypothetical protein
VGAGADRLTALEHAGQGPAATGEPNRFRTICKWGRARFKQMLLCKNDAALAFRQFKVGMVPVCRALPDPGHRLVYKVYSSVITI